jgi:hypothetical protein
MENSAMLLKIQSSKTMQMKHRVTEARVHTHVKKKSNFAKVFEQIVRNELGDYI